MPRNNRKIQYIYKLHPNRILRLYT